MKNKYIKINKIYSLIQEAVEEKRIIYIYSPVGYGKTSAVKYYLKGKPYLLMSCIDGYLKEKPEIKDLNGNPIIIDDLSWIDCEISKHYIINLINNYQGTLILIGRSAIPSWLSVISMNKHFIIADVTSLTFTKDETNEFLKLHNIELPSDELEKVYNAIKGHALSLTYLSNYFSEGTKYSNDIREKVRLDLFHYFDKAFYEKWDEKLKEVLLATCQYESFSVEMAEILTGNNKITQILEKALEIGSFLEKHENNIYSYYLALRYYLQWKQQIYYTKDQIKENYERAALYYEMNDQIENALFYYEKADKKDKISNLLIKNAEKHPGTAHFF